MKELLVRVLAHDEDLDDFEMLLKRHYAKVICTGRFKNSRPPVEDGFRGFYTVLKEESPR